MSFTVKLEKEITNKDIALELTCASEQDQCEILCEMSNEIKSWNGAISWPMQCRHITDYLGDDPRRKDIIKMLEDLIDHLKDE